MNEREKERKLNNKLFGAVKAGNASLVEKLLLENNVDISKIRDKSGSVLRYAVKAGNLDVVKLLINHAQDFHSKDSNTATSKAIILEILDGHDREHTGIPLPYKKRTGIPLPYFAIMEQHLNIAKFLFDCGYNVNYKNSDNSTMLHRAAKEGNLVAAEFLFKYGAVIINDRSFNTPLHIAARKGHTDIVKLSLEHGADINDTDEFDMTPLDCALKSNKIYTADIIANHIEKLEVAGKYVSEWNLELKSQVMLGIKERIFLHNHKPLIDALSKYYRCNFQATTFAEIKTFFEEHKDEFIIEIAGTENNKGELTITEESLIDFVDFKDALVKHAPTLKLLGFAALLMRQITLNEQLFAAAKAGNANLVNELLEVGADANAHSEDNCSYKDGYTALHIAAEMGCVDVVKVLLAHKDTKVDTKSKNQYTPLHIAAENGRLDVVEVLLNNKADIEAENCSNSTPLYLCCINGHTKTLEFLIKKGANVNKIDIAGYNLLVHCIDNFNIIKLLLENGMDINLGTKENVESSKSVSYAQYLSTKLSCGDKRETADLILNHIVKLKAGNSRVDQKNLQFEDQLRKIIFIHNYEQAVDLLLKQLGKDPQMMTFVQKKTFFEKHRKHDKFQDVAMPVSTLTDLYDIKTIHVPMLKVLAFKRVVDNVNSNLNNTKAEQHQAQAASRS